MAVEIKGSYRGNLNIEVVHGPSGTRLTTAAPVDNQGDGSSFSPTDLAATALGTCMLTLIGITAQRHPEIDLSGLAFRVEKHMVDNPRRIGRLPVTIEMPAGIAPDVRKKLERSALTCPVHKSLHPDVEMPVEFVYPEEPAET